MTNVYALLDVTSNGMKSTIAIVATINTCLLSESELADIVRNDGKHD